MTEHYVTAEVIAQRYGVQVETVWKWCQKKVIPHYRPSKRMIRFKIAETDEWMEKNKVEARRL